MATDSKPGPIHATSTFRVHKTQPMGVRVGARECFEPHRRPTRLGDHLRPCLHRTRCSTGRTIAPSLIANCELARSGRTMPTTPDNVRLQVYQRADSHTRDVTPYKAASLHTGRYKVLGTIRGPAFSQGKICASLFRDGRSTARAGVYRDSALRIESCKQPG